MSDSSGNVVEQVRLRRIRKSPEFPGGRTRIPSDTWGQFGVMDEGNGLLYMRARYYDPDFREIYQ